MKPTMRLKHIWHSTHSFTFRVLRLQKRVITTTATTTTTATAGLTTPTEIHKKRKNRSHSRSVWSVCRCRACKKPSMSLLPSALQVLATLYDANLSDKALDTNVFVNASITAKMMRQLQDPLTIAFHCTPPWCQEYSQRFRFLFPFDARKALVRTKYFGVTRAINRLKLSPAIASDLIGRIPRIKVAVPRDSVLSAAKTVLRRLSRVRAVLEVQFFGEVGIGLGPTLEFYSLVAQQIQQRSLSLWLDVNAGSPDDNENAFIIPAAGGLFPAPFPKVVTPQDALKLREQCELFEFLGRFLARALMDERIIDLPLGESFFKWVCGAGRRMGIKELKLVSPWLAKGLARLEEVCVAKRALVEDGQLTRAKVHERVNALCVDGCKIEDLCLDFTFPGTEWELIPGGKDTVVTAENVEEYVRSVLRVVFVSGVAAQREAFVTGFADVIPLDALKMFSVAELCLLLCVGSGAARKPWTVKELVQGTICDHGYTKESKPVQALFEVLTELDGPLQKKFISFITGAPVLPAGGFADLRPRLTIVKKDAGTGQADSYLPSVMTCANYLKLPAYSSKQVLRERLLLALFEGANEFHLS